MIESIVKRLNFFSQEKIDTAEERRFMYLYCLPVALLVMVSDLLFAKQLNLTAQETLMIPLLLTSMSILLGMLLFTRIKVAYVEMFLFVIMVSALDATLLIHISYLDIDATIAKILSYGFWSITIYMCIFWVFEMHQAQTVAWFHATLLLLSSFCVLFFRNQEVLLGPKVIYLLQSFAGQSIFILMLLAYTKMIATRQSAVQHFRYKAYTDELTTLANRHYLNLALIDQFTQAQQSDHSFAIILVDIDHFKQVNDTHGHTTGDQILRAFAKRIQREIASHHIIGRWGGEEFIIILPGADLSDAQTIAEHLQSTIVQTNFLMVKHLTASFGLCQYHANDSTMSLIERADRALYQAKQSGRNQVKVGDTMATTYPGRGSALPAQATAN